MDYYYSLLENYEQLKRRKFRLSLREDEGGNAVGDSRAAIDKALNGGEGYEESGLGNKQNLTIKYSGKEGNKAARVTGSNLGSYGVEFRQRDLTKWPSKKAEPVIAAWEGGGEKEGGDGDGDKTQDDVSKEPQTVSLDAEIAKVQQQVEISFRELAKLDNITPGIEAGKTGRGKTMGSIANIITGEAQGFIGDINQKLLNSEDLSPEEKLGVLEGLQQIDLSIRKLRERAGSDEPMTEAEARKLGKLLESIKITRGGVLIRGIGVNFRQKSTVKNDPLRNLVEQLNAEAEAYNQQIDKLPEEDQRKYRVPIAKPPASPPKSGGEDESYRGPVAEKFMTISVVMLRGQHEYAQAKTGSERKQILQKMRDDIADTYEDALNDGSYDQMMQTFARGRSVALGEMLAKGQEQISDAEFVVECKRVLVEEMGMDPKKADELLKDAAGQGKPDRQLMMSILVTSFVNQTFDQKLFGDDPKLLPSKITHEGGDDMTDSGAKADLKFTFDADCDKVKAAYEAKLGSTPKDGCSEGGGGIDRLLTSNEGGGCTMEVELKTLTSSKSKGGIGDLSDSRRQAICDDAPVGSKVPGGMTQGTKDFANKNKERLDNCLGMKGVQDKACKKQKAIVKLGAKYQNILTPAYPGVTVEAADAFIDRWFKGKTDNDKMKNRKEAAKRAMRSQPPPTEEDLKELDKVRQDIQQEVLKQNMPQGEIKDVGWESWLTTSYSLAAGTMEETLRVTRGLEDNYQSVYLNNAVVESNLRKLVPDENGQTQAYYQYDGGGTIKLVDRKTGVTLASCDTARGNQKWTMGPKAGQKNVVEAVEQEELFMTFLKGQRELLEKLMHQTNNGPST
jgi:hypothetical protein